MADSAAKEVPLTSVQVEALVGKVFGLRGLS
jgi:hypothetical protein